ncbi:MAG: hypothetical protein ACXVXP_03085 [Mycobacteriaceae bacterium]
MPDNGAAHPARRVEEEEPSAWFAVSAALLGCAVGAWFAGDLANSFGRPRVMVRGRPGSLKVAGPQPAATEIPLALVHVAHPPSSMRVERA